MPPAPTPTPATTYDERLTAPRSWWFIAFLFGFSMALVFFPFGLLPALLALAVGTGIAASTVSAQGSARIRIVGGLLVAGDARIPVAALGEPETLEGEEARAWRTHRADLRAFTLMRGYVPTALRVEVVDPADPTPYVYLSTRSPEALAEAIRSAALPSGPSGATGGPAGP
ncbi:DUF3093 domain-containing protein [Streptomyces sp. NPDC093249]|uniref:DUF3093 domain-containing protein n=1 Tax=unclassified Streptomyces TaxID=2593676 RepID=UPI00344C48F4